MRCVSYSGNVFKTNVKTQRDRANEGREEKRVFSLSCSRFNVWPIFDETFWTLQQCADEKDWQPNYSSFHRQAFKTILGA